MEQPRTPNQIGNNQMVIFPNYQMNTPVLQSAPMYASMVMPYYPNNYSAMMYPIQNQVNNSSTIPYPTMQAPMNCYQTQQMANYHPYPYYNYQMNMQQAQQLEPHSYSQSQSIQNNEQFKQSNIKEEQQTSNQTQKIENDEYDLKYNESRKVGQRQNHKLKKEEEIPHQQTNIKESSFQSIISEKPFRCVQIKEYRVLTKKEEEEELQHQQSINSETKKSKKIKEKKILKVEKVQKEEFVLHGYEEIDKLLERLTPEQDQIINEVQHVNTQNCFRNLLKQLQKFANTSLEYIYEYENQNVEKLNGKDLSNINVIKVYSPKQHNRKMFYQKFNKFIKSKKFNISAIKQVVNNKLYSLTLDDFLQRESETWLDNLNSVYKEDMRRFVKFLMQCLKDNQFLEFLHRPVYQHYKLMQNSLSSSSAITTEKAEKNDKIP